MEFGHEKLDVYQLAIRYAGWSFQTCKHLKGSSRFARDQLLRSSQSIAQNIAEGNGKGTEPDRRRFFEIARGSALECAATQDLLKECECLSDGSHAKGRDMLIRIVSMLTRLGGR
ncbi:MAG: four helix bundle protein [Opitutales bacterium]